MNTLGPPVGEIFPKQLNSPRILLEGDRVVITFNAKDGDIDPLPILTLYVSLSNSRSWNIELQEQVKEIVKTFLDKVNQGTDGNKALIEFRDKLRDEKFQVATQDLVTRFINEQIDFYYDEFEENIFLSQDVEPKIYNGVTKEIYNELMAILTKDSTEEDLVKALGDLGIHRYTLGISGNQVTPFRPKKNA